MEGFLCGSAGKESACHAADVGSIPGGSDGKESACGVGDERSIPGSGRSSGEGNGNPLQYSCLENPMGRGVWQATVREVTKSRTRLSDFTTVHQIMMIVVEVVEVVVLVMVAATIPMRSDFLFSP